MKRIPRRIFTAEFKLEVIKLVTEHGLTHAEAARKLDIATKSLREWKEQHERGELKASLGISYPTRAAVDTALASPQRAAAKAATEAVLERYFTGRIHHHITQAVERVG